MITLIQILSESARKVRTPAYAKASAGKPIMVVPVLAFVGVAAMDNVHQE